jgi:hypothetical protein
VEALHALGDCDRDLTVAAAHVEHVIGRTKIADLDECACAARCCGPTRTPVGPRPPFRHRSRVAMAE